MGLGGASGLDDHDWLSDVCRSLEMDEALLYRKLVPVWIERNQTQARAFMDRITTAARRPF
jgi:hypothetical protein